ncbi:MAG: hypothetical protein ACYC1M_09230 [Armatimonadota bacterium]
MSCFIAIAVGICCFMVLSVLFSTVVINVRAKAKQTGCLNDLRKIGVALKIYTDDYDGTLPLANSWHLALYPYTKHEAPFHCVRDTPWNWKSREIGYGMNKFLDHVVVAQISHPAGTVFAFDTYLHEVNPSGGREAVGFVHKRIGVRNANIMFVDGHADSVTDRNTLLTKTMTIDQVLWRP